jgi:DNA-binding response OmpR family regulator
MTTGEKKKLGRILVARRMVAPEVVDRVVAEQSRKPPTKVLPLASTLIAAGHLTEADGLRALSEQIGVPGLDLTQIVILLEHLAFVPREVAERGLVIPVLIQDDHIFVAMANPSDQRATDELEFVTGRRVRAYVALHTTLKTTILKAYDARDRGDTYYFGHAVPKEKRRQLGDASVRDSVPPPAPSTSGPSVVLGKSGQQKAHAIHESFGKEEADSSVVALLPEGALESAGMVGQPAVGLASGKTVLVVEDEADIRGIITRLLKARNHRVVEADRGLLALQMVKEYQPDLIILDAMLPELHGFEIARRLKGSERYGKIPILMVSATHRGWRVMEDAKSNLKIDEYLEKPFRVSDLVAAVERLFSASVVETRDPEAIGGAAKRLLESGVEAYRQGRLAEAIAHLKRATEVDPLAFRARYHLGLLYGKTNQVFEGISELERAAELHPKSFATLKNLAILYEKAGFKNKAVEAWERALGRAETAEIQQEIRGHLLTLL